MIVSEILPRSGCQWPAATVAPEVDWQVAATVWAATAANVCGSPLRDPARCDGPFVGARQRSAAGQIAQL